MNEMDGISILSHLYKLLNELNNIEESKEIKLHVNNI